MTTNFRIFMTVALLMSAVSAANGEEEQTRRDAQNPVASVVSVPFQNNTFFNYGPLKNTANVLIVEPVVPFKVNSDWNLITRSVIPVIYLPRLSAEQGSESGLGNIQPEFYLSPAHTGKIIWGAGVKLYFPTATDGGFGVNKWGGGPAVAALTTHGPWVAGVLANNVWAGSGANRVNLMMLNPFAYYNMKDGWYLVSSPVVTANWVAEHHDRWSVPVGGGVGRLFKAGEQLVNARFQALYNVARPDFAPNWQLQVQVQFLFPKH